MGGQLLEHEHFYLLPEQFGVNIQEGEYFENVTVNKLYVRFWK